MEGSAQLFLKTDAQNSQAPAGASRYDTVPKNGPHIERWHLPLCLSIAADLRGRAEKLQESKHRADQQLAQVERDRGALWKDLAERIDRATAGEFEPAPVFTARDVELIRWFRLVQIRQIYRRTAKVTVGQRCQQADHLFHAVIAQLPVVERNKVNRELLP